MPLRAFPAQPAAKEAQAHLDFLQMGTADGGKVHRLVKKPSKQTEARKIASYRDFLRKTEEARFRETQMEAEACLKKIKEFIPSLCHDYSSIQKIVLFGSLAQGSITPQSDVDFYIEGIGPEEFWRLRLRLERQLNRDIDLITDQDDSDFVNLALTHSITLYERKSSPFKSGN
jgi:predicted nucleotidyltransferase